MTKRVWHSGPPPHVGWWNASRSEGDDEWRWWDGKHWSIFCFPTEPQEHVRADAYKRTSFNDIKWSAYWPKNARVPRIDPRRKA